MSDTLSAVGKIGAVSAGGWMVHIESYMPLIQALSLIVPVFLSTLVYLDNKKKARKKEEDSEKIE